MDATQKCVSLNALNLRLPLGIKQVNRHIEKQATIETVVNYETGEVERFKHYKADTPRDIKTLLKDVKQYSDFGSLSEMALYCNHKGYGEEFSRALEISNSFQSRTKRLRNRIQSYLNESQCTFLTLTFTDETLNKTSPWARRLLVIRYLKSQKVPYVANIDYGFENHREHYHALICSQSINYEGWHTYGSIKGKKVCLKGDNDTKTSLALARYISKLTNHAIKETTKGSKVIYSR